MVLMRELHLVCVPPFSHLYADIVKTLALGNSQAQPDLDSVLSKADFVTLHVPLSPSTENLIGEAQLAKMKKGAFLLNASRGTVVRGRD